MPALTHPTTDLLVDTNDAFIQNVVVTRSWTGRDGETYGILLGNDDAQVRLVRTGDVVKNTLYRGINGQARWFVERIWTRA